MTTTLFQLNTDNGKFYFDDKWKAMEHSDLVEPGYIREVTIETKEPLNYEDGMVYEEMEDGAKFVEWSCGIYSVEINKKKARELYSEAEKWGKSFEAMIFDAVIEDETPDINYFTNEFDAYNSRNHTCEIETYYNSGVGFCYIDAIIVEKYEVEDDGTYYQHIDYDYSYEASEEDKEKFLDFIR